MNWITYAITVCLSVCPSVTTSVILKRLNAESCKLDSQAVSPSAISVTIIDFCKSTKKTTKMVKNQKLNIVLHP